MIVAIESKELETWCLLAKQIECAAVKALGYDSLTDLESCNLSAEGIDRFQAACSGFFRCFEFWNEGVRCLAERLHHLLERRYRFTMQVDLLNFSQG